MAEHQTVTLTFDQLQKLMEGMIEKSNANMISAIQELKKPSEKELAAEKLAEERAAKELQLMIDTAKQEEATKLALQSACNHRKPNGVMDYAGQVHNDGKVRLICQICQKLMVNRPATQYDYQNGPMELEY